MTDGKFHRALLLEDELNLADTLKIALGRLNIPFEHVTTLAHARAALQAPEYDLLILDRMVPDGDGFEICREARAAGFSGSVLFLTALGDVGDRVAGLEIGADDYLPKPFSWEEFSARIRALYRRQYGLKPAVATERPGLWQRNAERLQIYGPKGWVELTPLEFKLALFLIDAKGAIVTRDDLLKKVWGFTLLPKTRTVDHFLGRLRKVFEEDAESPKHFLTVRGAGYRFEP